MKMKFFLGIMVSCFLGLSPVFAGDKTFTFITEEQPPYVGSNLKDRGWAWVVAKTAVESQGYTARLEIVPWVRAVKNSKKGKSDALFLAFWTEERLQWFEYTVPVAQVKSGLFKLKERADLKFNGDLKTLTPYRIGVCRACAVADEFDKADYLNKHFQEDTKDGLITLYKKRLDFVAANKGAVLSILQELEAEFNGISSDIILMKPVLQENDLLVAVSKKAPRYKEKLRDFNRGIKQLFLDGTYHRIQKEYGFSK